jgi:hypothetical protein
MAIPTAHTAKMLTKSWTPEVVQRAIFAEASAVNDVETLVALCGVANLDPRVEASLAGTSHVAVLLAWAQRPGRTTDELVDRFTHERRGRLLTHLATAEGLDPALYEVIAQRAGASVLACIVANRSVLTSLRHSCAQRIGSMLSKSSTVRFNYVLLDTDAELAEAAATKTTNLRIISALTHHIPTTSDVSVTTTETATETVGCLVNDDAHRRRDLAVERLLETLPHIDGEGSDWSQLAEITAKLVAAGIDANACDTLSGHIAKVHRFSQTDNAHFTEVMVTLRSDPGGEAEALEEITAAASGSAVHNAFCSITTRQVSARLHQRAHAAALINPNLDVRTYRQHLRDLRVDTVRSVLPCLLADGRSDVVEMLANRFDIRALISPPIKEQLLAMLCALEHPPAGLLARLPQLLLTTEQAMNTFTYHDLCARGWQIEVATAATAALGEDQQRWETFTRLVGEWHGSFATLLDSVDALGE